MEALARDLPPVRMVSFSAKTGLGRDDLWQEIRMAVQSHRALAS